MHHTAQEFLDRLCVAEDPQELFSIGQQLVSALHCALTRLDNTREQLQQDSLPRYED